MQAGGQPHAGEWPLLLEPLANQAQHRHLRLGPLDPELARAGQSQVFHVVMCYCQTTLPTISRKPSPAVDPVNLRRTQY